MFSCIPNKAQSLINITKCENISVVNKVLFQDYFSFKLNTKECTSTFSDKYFIEIPVEFSDTSGVVKSLLELEGDDRLLCFPVTTHSVIASKLYSGKKDLSVQVFALYLIWQLVFNDFDNCPYPVLLNNNTREAETVSGSIVKDAFVFYKKWFEENANNLKNKNPFDNTYIKWW
jgi:hypothetical protein